MARRRVSEHLRIRSPPPVDGRKHIDIQTELYLEQITDRVEEADVMTQTDAFLDRPSTPLFIPAKTGMDVATQIEDGDVRRSYYFFLLISQYCCFVFTVSLLILCIVYKRTY